MLKKKYQDIKNILRKNNIFFTVGGDHRHKDTDLIVFSNNTVIEPYSAFLSGYNLFSQGSFSYSWSNLPVSTVVGRYCSIAKNCTVLGSRHPHEWLTTSSSTYDNKFIIFSKFCDDYHSEHTTFKRKNLTKNHGLLIGNDVWIGNNVTLKNNLIIGHGAVIAANSTVVKDVPPYAIVGGNPAKIIKYRFSDRQINELLLLKWWEYKFTDFQQLNIQNIDIFIDQFYLNRDKYEKLSLEALKLD